MVSLVPATADDILWLFELHKAALKGYIEQLWEWDEAWQYDYFTSTLNLADSRIIMLNSRPIGRVTVEEHPEHTFLAYIALLPDYQGRGIGTQVIYSVLEGAKGPVNLSVLSPNPARALYERLGFIVTDQDEVRVMMRYG
jgi:ribosomal protein S18 acetylase RimI-like enzyme